MANSVRDLAKERRWREAVERFLRSGLSVRAFCRRERLAESAFHFWRRELVRRDGERPPCENSSCKNSPRGKSPQKTLALPDFLPVHVAALTDQAAIALELPGGCVLRLPAGVSAQWLAELVNALEARGPR